MELTAEEMKQIYQSDSNETYRNFIIGLKYPRSYYEKVHLEYCLKHKHVSSQRYIYKKVEKKKT